MPPLIEMRDKLYIHIENYVFNQVLDGSMYVIAFNVNENGEQLLIVLFLSFLPLKTVIFRVMAYSHISQ